MKMEGITKRKRDKLRRDLDPRNLAPGMWGFELLALLDMADMVDTLLGSVNAFNERFPPGSKVSVFVGTQGPVETIVEAPAYIPPKAGVVKLKGIHFPVNVGDVNEP